MILLIRVIMQIVWKIDEDLILGKNGHGKVIMDSSVFKLISSTDRL